MCRVRGVERSPEIPCIVHFRPRTGAKTGAGQRVALDHFGWFVFPGPMKTLVNINEVSAKDYEERCYEDTSMPFPSGPALPSPHLYELATKVCPS